MKCIRFILLLSIYVGGMIILQSCEKNRPTVETMIVAESDITTTTAIVKGSVTNNGGEMVIERGICYGLEQFPTEKKTASEGGNGEFEIELIGLSTDTEYFVRAYAINDIGTSHGQNESFRTKREIPPPAADFTVSDTIVDLGDDIQFFDESLNEPTSWSWDFGDGSTSQEKFPQHAYDTAGNYTVTLTASNQYGSDTKVKENLITAGHPPVADFTVSDTIQLKSIAVQFTDLSTNVPTSWRWSFEEGGEPSSEQNPVHTYTTRGPKKVSLTVSNALGSDTKTSVEGYITVKESVTDFDNNVYPVVQIGDQWWMAENLKVTNYADGRSILITESRQAWADLDNSDKACSWLFNDVSNRDTYGCLYSWAGAMDGASSSNSNPSNEQGVCPDGWHLPSDEEWKQLEFYLGMVSNELDEDGWRRGANMGGKLKEEGTEHWIKPNTGATNESGFTALPGSSLWSDGSAYEEGYGATFWTSSENNNSDVITRSLDHVLSEVGRFGLPKDAGCSVRCLKDNEN
jgi:uncharacterized protein (TIGR02145 family)